MHKLSVRDPTYAALYAQVCHLYPNAAKPLPLPDFGQPTMVAYQSPAPPSTAPYNSCPQQNHHGLSEEAASFFGKSPRTDGCAFCTLQGHLIKRCPAAEEYVRSGRATIRDGRIHLGNGQPIPNNGSGRGLKNAIDAWLAGTSSQPGEPSPVINIQTPGTAAFSRDPPPHVALSFEAIRHSADLDDNSNPNLPFPDTDLYDLQEVLTAEEKRRTRTSKLPEATPLPPVFPTPMPAPAPTPIPPTLAPAPRPSGASRPPQFKYQASIEDQKFTDELITLLLEGKLSNTTPAHILAASAPVRKAISDRLRPRRVETGAFEELGNQPSELEPATSRAADYSLPLREVDVVINGKTIDTGVLDQGSQIIAIRADLAKQVGATINTKNRLEMEGANSSTSWTIGCAENLSMSIGNINFQVHAYVVENAPFRLLLGRPFHNLLLSRLEDNADGSVNLSIHDPTDQSHTVQVPTKARRIRSGFTTTLAFQTRPPPPRMTSTDQHGLMQQITLQHTFPDSPTPVLAYKKAAKKVHPVAASLPEDFRIARHRPEDPLISLPLLPTKPPYFVPGLRLTQERLDAMNINKYKFLWPEEERLAQHVLKTNEHALAWTEAERGRFRDDYLAPVKIPTIAHTPWVHKNIPIPTGIMDKVIDLFKRKVAAGVYEPSDASYRSRWFCVKKKNGSLRIVHDLQPLNAVTIRNAAVPPFVDQFVESMAARACYSMLDLFVGYDHRTLDTSSRDLTSFQTPLGAFRCTVLPQGATNAVAIFHGDVTFILEPEIPHVAKPFVDDTAIRGPASRYETANGGYETIPENPGIRRFIWEHLNDVHRVIHRLGHAGATVSAPKLFIAAPEVVILGHKCNYNGRIPDESKTAKIKTWPVCKTVTDVRAFLGTAGTMRIWIKNYSAIARPLVDLTRKDTEFIWTPEHDHAMEDLKSAIINSQALIPIDYSTSRPTYLSVDSSWRAVGWILSQQGEDGQRRPSRFGSIGWNDRESRYSQPKIELYGLFRALRALRVHIVGITNLIVEMDAQFIKGMLNNPDVQPNAAMNRWIAAIKLFDFKLVHVPAETHLGPDGLSRREPIPGEDNDEGDPEDWVDEVLALGIWANTKPRKHHPTACVFETEVGGIPPQSQADPQSNTPTLETDLEAILKLLTTGIRDSTVPQEQDPRVKKAKRFLAHNGRLWRRQAQGRNQLVIPISQRMATIREAHDGLGHKGFYSTLRTLLDRFWWPTLANDVKQHITTCHECQIRQTTKIHIPPVVATPAPLFRKAYIDTMLMPHAAGFRYIVQARCSLTAWPEWRALRVETGRTLAAFIFEDLLCRWGAVEEIVTDNGTAFVAALDTLADRYGIRHIRISAYNSRANGIVERQHRTIRESLVKACEGNITKWPTLAPHAFWADRVTTRKATGHSPFYMAHGVEPILPFDITLATFLVPDIAKPLSTSELLAIRARQLQKRDEDLAAIHDNVLKSRFESVRQFERMHEKSLRDFDFKPGALVLVRNSSIETDLGRKSKPRYLGPMVVVRRTPNGSYRLAELDGAVSKLRFAAFRLIPYHARSRSSIPVTRLVEREDLIQIYLDEDQAEEEGVEVEAEQELESDRVLRSGRGRC